MISSAPESTQVQPNIDQSPFESWITVLFLALTKK